MPKSNTKWTLHAIDRFGDFAEAWDRVNNAVSGPPFLHSLFIRNLLHVFGSGTELLAVLGEPGREQALGIVRSKQAGVWETYQPAQLPLGAWVMDHSVQYPEVLASLLRALPNLPLLLAVTQQDPSTHARPPDAGALRALDYIETAWIDVQGPFDAYWGSRGKNLQQNMRKQRSKLVAQGLEGTMEVITRPDGVADAIADYGRLEGAGWKGAQGTAILADNDQGRFYRAVLEDFCRMGAARIYRYRFGDRVVAVDLCIESPTVQVVLKTTYDESIKALSPSSMLRQDAYRQIFDEARIRRIEFYGRIMEWTTRWTDCRRTLYHVNAYRWDIVSVAASRLAGLRGALQRRMAGAATN